MFVAGGAHSHWGWAELRNVDVGCREFIIEVMREKNYH